MIKVALLWVGDLSNWLDTTSSLNVVKKVVDEYGTPTILNSFKGSQFNCKEQIDYLESNDTQISLDGKVRAWIIFLLRDFREQ